jgi:hypothetical protein
MDATRFLIGRIVGGDMRWLFLTLMGLIASGVQGGTPGGGSQPRVSLPKGADLRAALAALSTSAGATVILADASVVPSSLSVELAEAPLETALRQISLDFDRAIVRQGRVMVLQRRFSHPDEDPGLEIEELRLAAIEMDRLMEPFRPPFVGVQYIQAKASFVASITAEQEARMRDGGLAVTELPKSQRDLWLKINTTQAYETAARELRRARLCLTQWDRVTVEDLWADRFPKYQLFARFPDPSGIEGRDGVHTLAPSTNLRPRKRSPELAVYPDVTGKVPETLRPSWPIGLQEADLEKLPRLLEGVRGPKLSTPAYAKSRHLWIASRGTRHEVLSGLGLLWGWELKQERGGYRLGLPRPTPARTPAELREKLVGMVPPALRQSIDMLVEEVATERCSQQMKRVIQAADKVAGAGWRTFRVADLDARSQKSLADVAAAVTIGKAVRPSDSGERHWVLYPERARLFLSGPLGPDLHPNLMALLEDDRGQTVGWGWAVGTARTGPGNAPRAP